MTAMAETRNAEYLRELADLLSRSGVEASRADRLARELLAAQVSRSRVAIVRDGDARDDLLEGRLDLMRSDQDAALASIKISLSTQRQELRELRSSLNRSRQTRRLMLGAVLLVQMAILALCLVMLNLGLHDNDQPSPGAGDVQPTVAMAWKDS